MELILTYNLFIISFYPTDLFHKLNMVAPENVSVKADRQFSSYEVQNFLVIFRH